MARRKSSSGSVSTSTVKSKETPKTKTKTKSKPRSPGKSASWTELTWDHLDRWAGSRSVQRGRSYQRGGRVKQLAISTDGHLLAWVMGTYRYATTVALSGKAGSPVLESTCTCPVGISCKHAVATVAAYLDALASGQDVPTASEDDPRWDELELGGFSGEDWNAGLDDDLWAEDDDEDGESEDEDEDDLPAASVPSLGRIRGTSGDRDWQEKVDQHIRSRPPTELAELVVSLTRRYPELFREFKERIALQSGDVDRLVADARRAIRRVTAQDAWRNPWSGEGNVPDYEPIRHRLERLRELGHADEVVELGRLLIDRGFQQVGQAHDEGETSEAFASCLPVVFEALSQSSLPGPDRLLMAIDAVLADDFGIIGEEVQAVLDAPVPAEDWSAVADALKDRLAGEAPPTDDPSEVARFHHRYQRKLITNWIATALENSGRSGELQEMLEAEARRNLSYERLVDHLIRLGRLDDAERWALEGISRTVEPYPGIASHLADRLLELARGRKRWDVVAAHAAFSFFDRPAPTTFDELMKAARKARVEPAVREAALRFLETGVLPVRPQGDPEPMEAESKSKSKSKAGSRSKSKPKAKSNAKPDSKSPALQRAEASRSARSATGVRVDPGWPLPVPEYLLPMLSHAQRFDPESRPRLDVLLELAIASKDPDEILKWYDRLRSGAEAGRSRGFGGLSRSLADRVAGALADARPDQAIAIYREGLDAQLPHAQPSAYEAAADYLRKLRPLYRAVGRPEEWDALLASIRESYRNRPRFMEQLDRLEDRPIVQTPRPRSRRR